MLLNTLVQFIVQKAWYSMELILSLCFVADLHAPTLLQLTPGAASHCEDPLLRSYLCL